MYTDMNTLEMYCWIAWLFKVLDTERWNLQSTQWQHPSNYIF